MSQTYALQILKGGSARLFFRFHERARLRYPKGHLWSPGKFAASIGFIQLETAKIMWETRKNITIEAPHFSAGRMSHNKLLKTS